MGNIVYFELNDWAAGKYYPNVEPFSTWIEMIPNNKYYNTI